mmetsp:Transcript_93007/g.147018  ORF Transcript_93007/g.147018 Transcript_93007/m.147018 type:complete len:82 (+) Transcript_93007:125-370(+)
MVKTSRLMQSVNTAILACSVASKITPSSIDIVNLMMERTGVCTETTSITVLRCCMGAGIAPLRTITSLAMTNQPIVGLRLP